MNTTNEALISALKNAVTAMMNARLAAMKVDDERGDRLNWKGAKCFPANQAVVHATQDALDEARVLIAGL
jgi:hypothetical protein